MNLDAKSCEKEFKVKVDQLSSYLFFIHLFSIMIQMMWANYRDTVKLKFEAFAAGSYNQICAPVYSQRIRYKSMTFTVNVIKSIFFLNLFDYKMLFNRKSK